MDDETTGFRRPGVGGVRGARTAMNSGASKPGRTPWARLGRLTTALFAAVGFSQACSPAPKDEGRVSRSSAEWYQSAYDKRHHNDFDGAIADAGEAIQADPNNAKAWLERGISRLPALF